MEGPITDSAREAMLLAALTRVDAAVLPGLAPGRVRPPVPDLQADRQRPGRAAQAPGPQVGARTGPVPGRPARTRPPSTPSRAWPRSSRRWATHADDPTRDQLLEAIDAVGADYDDVTVAVMLASVADGDMAASDLCFTLLDTEERFGLTGWRAFERTAAPDERRARAPASGGATEEQREARRAKKQRDAEERRRKAEAAARAAEQVRQARKKERAAPRPPLGARPGGPAPAPVLPEPRPPAGRADPARRRRSSTATTRGRPAWSWPGSRSTPTTPDHPGLDGKVRPCVVIAGSRHPPSGPSRVLGGRGEEPRLEVASRAPLAAVGVRRADVDRRDRGRGSRARGGPDRIPRTRRLELALVTWRWAACDVRVTA